MGNSKSRNQRRLDRKRAKQQGRPGEELDMKLILFRLMGGGKYQLMMRWNAGADCLELLTAQYGTDPKDGSEVVVPVATSMVGDQINKTVDQRVITPHSLAAAVVRLLMASQPGAQKLTLIDISKLPVVDPSTLQVSGPIKELEGVKLEPVGIDTDGTVKPIDQLYGQAAMGGKSPEMVIRCSKCQKDLTDAPPLERYNRKCGECSQFDLAE